MEPVQRTGTEMRTSHRAEFARLQRVSVVESFFFFSPVPRSPLRSGSYSCSVNDARLMTGCIYGSEECLLR